MYASASAQRDLLEDHRLVPVEQHAVFAVPLDGARQHLAFGVAADGREVFHRLAVVHAGCFISRTDAITPHLAGRQDDASLGIRNSREQGLCDG